MAQPHSSITSKVLSIVLLLVLLLILGACVFIIYGYVSPHGPITKPTATTAATPVATYTPIPATATPRPTPIVTPPPDSGFYQQDNKITMDEFQYYYPGIWDHYVVYDMFDGYKNYTMLYDFNTRETTQVADGTVFSYGTISNGQLLLYYPIGSKVYLYNIKERKSYLTCTNDDNARGSFSMSGTKLAYYQDVGHFDTAGKWAPAYSIRVFSMVDGTAASVIDNTPRPLDMQIYDNRLVYTIVNGDGSDVYFLDLGVLNPKPRRISSGTGDNNNARIYDNTIVYQSDVSGKHHIYAYDIPAGKTSLLTEEGEQYHADIYGNTIVYDDNRNGNWDIYAYDLGANAERRLTNEPHDQMAPVIYGNRIAYMDYRMEKDFPAIYTMTI
jgi:beta propeller repeat protein